MQTSMDDAPPAILATFRGPDAPTWDADEIEAWYTVAQQIHDDALPLDDPAGVGED